MTTVEHLEPARHVVDGGKAAEARNPFQRLAPTTTAYATLPIWASFNWSDCVAGVEAGAWYLVAFRSVHRATADPAVLAEYDDRAHQEARNVSGLLYYFKGQANERRECLSFCLWQSRHQAQAAARLPRHRAAMRIVNEMYESYTLERYVVRKHGSAEGGHLVIEQIPFDQRERKITAQR